MLPYRANFMSHQNIWESGWPGKLLVPRLHRRPINSEAVGLGISILFSATAEGSEKPSWRLNVL